MTRACLTLNNDEVRAKARRWIDAAPVGTRVEFHEPRRTLPQNDIMHGIARDISTQLLWHGIKLSVDDWKLVFMDALKREVRIVPNLDGTGFVNLGRSSSKLSTPEMSQMITLMIAFADRHGVKLSCAPLEE